MKCRVPLKNQAMRGGQRTAYPERSRKGGCPHTRFSAVESMFVRLVYESFRRQTRRKLLVAIAVTLGAAVSTAMIAIATDIGDKISNELRTYDANLVVKPEGDNLDVQIGSVNLIPAGSGAYLKEADLP